jgi:hypothetical protein
VVPEQQLAATVAAYRFAGFFWPEGATSPGLQDFLASCVVSGLLQHGVAHVQVNFFPGAIFVNQYLIDGGERIKMPMATAPF